MTHFRPLLAALPLCALLAACGGGNDETPAPTTVSGSLAVSNATTAGYNGTYASSNVSLTRVDWTSPVGGQTVCTFKFSGLQQQGSTRLLSGDIRYVPFQPVLRTSFITIDGVEWQMTGSTNASVDRTNNRVQFAGAVFTGSNGQNGTITLTGDVPMLGDRPSADGC
jgi:hypothetical protein